MTQKKLDGSLAGRNFRPVLKLDAVLRPFQRFMDIEASGGILLMIATLTALFLSNTSLSGWYGAIWDQHLALQFGSFHFDQSLLHLVNDGLMTLFFFLVGLEIKRETVWGELRSFRSALFPVFGALGGMVVPAALFLLSVGSGEGHRGWGIPMATDIAFAVGFLSLLGKRVPHSLKIFLLTLAIADDLGAILVIAIVYAKAVTYEYLALSLLFYLFVFVLNFLGVRRLLPYAAVGVLMWYFLLRSGVHPTLAGVLLGLATPSRRLVSSGQLGRFIRLFQTQLDRHPHELDREPIRAIGREASSPLERIEVDLHPWVAFLIMPLFALANAGVAVELSALQSRVTWAVMIGLVIGKPLGVFAFSWAALRLRWVKLPAGITLKTLFAASCLAGVGFTMSLFISSLALEGELLESAKVGTLLGSAGSAAIGLILLHRFLDRREPDPHLTASIAE